MIKCRISVDDILLEICLLEGGGDIFLVQHKLNFINYIAMIAMILDHVTCNHCQLHV